MFSNFETCLRNLQPDFEGSFAFLYHSKFEAHKSVSEFVDGMLPVLFDVMRHINCPAKLVNLFEDRPIVRGFCLLVKVNQTCLCLYICFISWFVLLYVYL